MATDLAARVAERLGWGEDPKCASGRWPCLVDRDGNPITPNGSTIPILAKDWRINWHCAGLVVEEMERRGFELFAWPAPLDEGQCIRFKPKGVELTEAIMRTTAQDEKIPTAVFAAALKALTGDSNA